MMLSSYIICFVSLLLVIEERLCEDKVEAKLVHVNTPPCPSNGTFFRVPDTDICLHLGVHAMTWQKAYDSCVAMGANLLTVLSDQEQLALTNWMRNPCDNCIDFLKKNREGLRFFYHWIGLTDDGHNWWHWNYGIHKLPLDPTVVYWDTDLEEPATNMGCVTMLTGKMGWTKKWRVYNCHWKRPYLCSVRY